MIEDEYEPTNIKKQLPLEKGITHIDHVAKFSGLGQVFNKHLLLIVIIRLRQSDLPEHAFRSKILIMM